MIPAVGSVLTKQEWIVSVIALRYLRTVLTRTSEGMSQRCRFNRLTGATGGHLGAVTRVKCLILKPFLLLPVRNLEVACKFPYMLPTKRSC